MVPSGNQKLITNDISIKNTNKQRANKVLILISEPHSHEQAAINTAVIKKKWLSDRLKIAAIISAPKISAVMTLDRSIIYFLPFSPYQNAYRDYEMH